MKQRVGLMAVIFGPDPKPPEALKSFSNELTGLVHGTLRQHLYRGTGSGEIKGTAGQAMGKHRIARLLQILPL